MKKNKRTSLHLEKTTIRVLSTAQLSPVYGGEINSGSGGGSTTCPPPKNGEGSGCLTG